MLSAIELDDDAWIETSDVREVSTDGGLAAKVSPANLTGAEL